jgi:hypothetical protein
VIGADVRPDWGLQQAAHLADHRRGSRQTAVPYGVRKHTVHGGVADLTPFPRRFGRDRV